MALASKEEPREVGVHGRLSSDYVQEILGLASDTPPLNAARPGTVHGRLTAGYADAVAELLGNPAAAFRLIVDERFETGRHGWPAPRDVADPSIQTGYPLLAGPESPFTIVGAPIGAPVRDMVVNATFRKFGGPPGGSYGLVVRDLGPAPRDGRNVTGRYYLAEVSDRGQFSIRRPAQDHPVDIV